METNVSPLRTHATLDAARADTHAHRWDEWVLGTRLLKLNDTNLALQKSLVQAQKAASSAPAKSHAAGASGSGVGGGRRDGRKDGRKRGRDDVSSGLTALNLALILFYGLG